MRRIMSYLYTKEYITLMFSCIGIIVSNIKYNKSY
jgi:hypothetical protein